MIKLIIFDLDGVLVDTKDIHFDALNKALGAKYAIDMVEHLRIYDGLKTRQKLEMLSELKGLPVSMHDDVWQKKQRYTAQALSAITKNETLVHIFSELRSDSYKIAVCSNSIQSTVDTVLKALGLYYYVDFVFSNEDVVNSKPHPEMYWRAMAHFGVYPRETVILEDSPYGLQAAYASGANIMRVNNSSDVTVDAVYNYIETLNTNGNMKQNSKWDDHRLNVLIPMAGAGSRFEKAGYTFPKPLIEVHGKPMIQVVVENLNINANYIYVVQRTHRLKYNLDTMLNIITPGCTIIEVDGVTEGAACTALLAKEYVNNDRPLFFANSDQFVEWDSVEFMYKMVASDVDGGIVTFNATHPKWSFVRLDGSGNVVEVAEKNPISDIATVGFYYWKHGRDFVTYAEGMIDKDIRVNGEFYVAPVFNEAIADGKIIKTYNAKAMYGLGTPEDLDYFLKHK